MRTGILALAYILTLHISLMLRGYLKCKRCHECISCAFLLRIAETPEQLWFKGTRALFAESAYVRSGCVCRYVRLGVRTLETGGHIFLNLPILPSVNR